MPYKHTAKKIPRELDKRRKLTDEDRREIKELHLKGTPIREIARLFGDKCSRRLIQFVLFPNRCKKVDNKKYYNKEKHREYTKKHRRYKQELYKANELK